MYTLKSKELVEITVPNTRNEKKNVILKIITRGFYFSGNKKDANYNVVMNGEYFYTENGEDITLDQYSKTPRPIATLQALQVGLPALSDTQDVCANILQRIPELTEAMADLEEDLS